MINQPSKEETPEVVVFDLGKLRALRDEQWGKSEGAMSRLVTGGMGEALDLILKEGVKELHVVCDANGTCHGVFTDKAYAVVLAGQVDGYLSTHQVDIKGQLVGGKLIDASGKVVEGP